MVNLAVPLVTPGSLVNYSGSDTPEVFFESMRKLMDHVRQSANTVVPGGTTGESHLLKMKQYRSLLEAVVRFRWDLHVRAWVLGRDEHVGTQIQIARELWIDETMIGCGHTGDFEVRVATAREATLPTGKIVLYNMPGWSKPLPLEFVVQCFADKRIIGIKDSSGDAEYFDKLLTLRASFPWKIISHGSEPLYGRMSADRRGLVDEVTAWTANLNPRLLRDFIENPEKFGGERDALGAMIWGPHAGFDTSTPGWAIQNYIYGLKTTLRLQGILTGAEDFLMYGDKAKWFFPID